jgi:hypothetical protein
MWGMAGTAASLSAFIRGTGDSVLPVIAKVGGSVDLIDELREAGT